VSLTFDRQVDRRARSRSNTLLGCRSLGGELSEDIEEIEKLESLDEGSLWTKKKKEIQYGFTCGFLLQRRKLIGNDCSARWNHSFTVA
jgi:hypothetical protein